MRILFLTCHLPYPPFSGGRLREFELIKRLSRRNEISVCAVSKTYQEDVAAATQLADLCEDVRIFPASTSTSVTGPSSCAQVLRHRCPEMTDHVAAAIETIQPDVIHVEGFYVMQHVPERPPCPVFLVEQNVEYLLWKQRAEASVGRDERERYLREYLVTLDSETAAWTRADMCAAVTDDDRRAMLAAAGSLDVRVVPDGFDHLVAATPDAAGAEPLARTLAFIANFGYEPNVDAAHYLLERIFPRIRSRVPNAELFLVGNAPPPSVHDIARVTPGVTVTGRVASVEPYLDQAAVIVCPLRVGGGVKVKVLEALSRGKAIVTTSVGAQGLGAGAIGALEIHDRSEAFVDATVRLLRRPRRRLALEQRARALAKTLPTWDEAAATLQACYDEICQTSASPVLRLQEAGGIP